MERSCEIEFEFARADLDGVDVYTRYTRVIGGMVYVIYVANLAVNKIRLAFIY